MPLFNHFPYTNMHELNIDWAIEKIKELVAEGEALYTELQSWKDDTDADLTEWKETTLAALEEWEQALTDSLGEWKSSTEGDISADLIAYKADLDAWQIAAENAWSSTKSAAEDAQTAAEAAADRAEAYAQVPQYPLLNGRLIETPEGDYTAVRPVDAVGLFATLESPAGATLYLLFNNSNLVYSSRFDMPDSLEQYYLQGTPVITADDYYSPAKSLKCFGSVSTHVRFTVPDDGNEYYVACMVKVTRYTSGNAGVQAGSAAQMDVSTEVSDWTFRSTTLPASSVSRNIYIGSFTSANLDCYIDDIIIINKTATGLMKADLDDLIGNYLATESEYSVRYKRPSNTSIYAVSVGNATSTTNRFIAAKKAADALYALRDYPLEIPSLSGITEAQYISACPVPSVAGSPSPIFSKAGTTTFTPASLTKVLTAVTALAYNPDLSEYVDIVADDLIAGSGAYLAAGDKVTVLDLLYGMFLPSSNSSAQALARWTGLRILNDPSASSADAITAFLAAMNAKAEEIGMEDSSFANASGVSAETNVMTASDCVKLTQYAEGIDVIRRIWLAKEYTVQILGSDPRTETIQTSISNATLEAAYNIRGGKTGTIGTTVYNVTLILEHK